MWRTICVDIVGCCWFNCPYFSGCAFAPGIVADDPFNRNIHATSGHEALSEGSSGSALTPIISGDEPRQNRQFVPLFPLLARGDPPGRLDVYALKIAMFAQVLPDVG